MDKAGRPSERQPKTHHLEQIIDRQRKFLVKLFSKSFGEYRPLEKRRHPGTFFHSFNQFSDTGRAG
ncbi:hypothetical protein F1542_03135 [Komagataeibacter sp. FXV3]|nr:hypothetical protein [Komagataeibacter sp. FXV3]